MSEPRIIIVDEFGDETHCYDAVQWVGAMGADVTDVDLVDEARLVWRAVFHRDPKVRAHFRDAFEEILRRYDA